ncbi:uncharacterized protein SPSC_04706 [Sporisorium scitamineum]|uniref:Uncharacterized protein n=1 Tax=Sporisorium scitamineum TaxID=49012 RepID=A0A127ZHD7_9BASI|nr:uncharacterized protein SPSC_04706 [Sporisorium scitamineum]
MAPTARGKNTRVDNLTSSQIEQLLEAYPSALLYKAAASTNRTPSNNESLPDLDNWYQSLPPFTSPTDLSSTIHTKQDLLKLTRWKLSREKHRPTLLSLISSNPAPLCTQILHRAASHLHSSSPSPLSLSSSNPQHLLEIVTSTMKILAQLRGVGPATSSAIVASWVDYGVFQSDELAKNLLGDAVKVEYTWGFYRRFYGKALEALKRISDEKGVVVGSGRVMERVAWSMVYSERGADGLDVGGRREGVERLRVKREVTSGRECEEEDGQVLKRKTREAKVEAGETAQSDGRTRRTSKRLRKT